MTLGRRVPKATALAAMGLLLTLGACGATDEPMDEPAVEPPAVTDVDAPAVPDAAEMVTYTCACGKTKELAADAAAPS